ncbi:class I SAM-dependent methyltransferase [Patescibacteria group bacterium]|nr:class I SAM-dependent methyltransferase [Patescibacteria group bacterium]
MRTRKKIEDMSYVELMAFLEETNRPPGGKSSIREVVQNCFINNKSNVLDVGCNTGYCTFEIAHLSKCTITGIDISKEMISTAKELLKKDKTPGKIKFIVGDAQKLSFSDGVFDVVFSGGSTAFVDDKETALKEYARVIKTWGFVADINFFYRETPPINLIESLNDMMGIKIEPWDKDYWLNIYEKVGLEEYLTINKSISSVSDDEIKKYSSLMTMGKSLDTVEEDVLKNRLIKIMSLFNENHKYLSYGIFISRKRPNEEQVTLFGS